MKTPKYEKGTLSLAHTAFLMQFPGKALDFLYWLRQRKLLSDDLRPLPIYVQKGLFVNQIQEIPGRTKGQKEQIIVPRITVKGLSYLSGLFNAGTLVELDPETNPLF